MKAKKRDGKRKAGKRAPTDLPAPKGKGPKGGSLSSSINEVMKNFGGALNTAARGG